MNPMNRRMVPVNETDYVEVQERGSSVVATYVRRDSDGMPKFSTVFNLWPNEWLAVADAVRDVVAGMKGESA